MAKFHRFVAPAYTNAPVLGPGDAAPVVFEGKDYDYFNVGDGAVAGPGAFLDSAKLVGPNAGTYCVAFGEDASSLNANRGFKALSENTDTIDDILHVDIAMPTRTAEVTPLAPVATIDLPANTFVGSVKGYPIEMLFEIVDGFDREVLDAGGVRVTVASIAGAAVGDGFSAGIVTLNLSNDIPTGQTYRVYYAELGNLATLPVDAFSYSQIRTAATVDAVLQDTLQLLHGGVGALWNDTWTATIYDLAFSGLNERYRRGATVDLDNAQHPVAYTPDTPGAGGWYERLSAGIVGFSADDTVADFTGSFGMQDHLFGAGWGYIASRKITASGVTHRTGYDSGFVYLGRKGTSEHDPLDGTGGMFGFFHGAHHPGGDADARTKIAPGLALTVNADVITLGAAGWFWNAEAGTGHSAIALGYDIITVDVGGVLHNLVIKNITAIRTAEVCYPDGATVNFAPAAGTVVRWVSPLFFTGDGATEAYEGMTGGSGTNLRGLFYATGPILEDPAVDASPWDEAPACFFGRQIADATHVPTPVVQWGAYDPESFEYVRYSSLYSDGGVEATRLRRTGITTKEIDVDDFGLLDGNTTDVLMMTVGAGAGADLKLTLRIENLQTGQEVHVILKHGSTFFMFMDPSLGIEDQWIATGGTIRMDPTDYATSGAIDTIDWWSFLNIGTYAAPILLGRVRRLPAP